MTQQQRIVLASRPNGVPSQDNFRLEQMDLPEPAEGQVLLRTIWISVDPYMRGRMNDGKSYVQPLAIGGLMEGGAVSEVMHSNNPKFAAGDIVQAGTGWASHSISNGKGLRKLDPSIAPVSTALGVLGMPGQTAWVGLNEIAKAQPGETIVVSAATGAVGSLVGQLAKIKGMRVIGVAGGPTKCGYAKDELGFDICLDHHAAKDAKALGLQIKEAAPDGVDVYFENVGSKTLEAVLPNMNTFGRIAVCGMIAWYSGEGIKDAPVLPLAWRNILSNRLQVRGFIVSDHANLWPDFVAEVAPLVTQGKIKYRETVTNGLENTPNAFLELLKGGNFGKQLVRVGPDPAG